METVTKSLWNQVHGKQRKKNRTAVKFCIFAFAIAIFMVFMLATNNQKAYASLAYNESDKLTEAQYQVDRNNGYDWSDYYDITFTTNVGMCWYIDLGSVYLHDFDCYHYGLAPDDYPYQQWDNVKLSYKDGKIGLEASEPYCEFWDWGANAERWERSRHDGLCAVFYFEGGKKEVLTIDACSSWTKKVKDNVKVERIRLCCWNYHNYDEVKIAEMPHYYTLDCDAIFHPDCNAHPAKRLYWMNDEVKKHDSGCFEFGSQCFYDYDRHHWLTFNDDEVQLWTNIYVALVDGHLFFSSVDTHLPGKTLDIYNDGLRAMVYFSNGDVESLTIDDKDFTSTSTKHKAKDIVCIEVQPWNNHASFASSYSQKSLVEDLNWHYFGKMDAELKTARDNHFYQPQPLRWDIERIYSKATKVYNMLKPDYKKKIDKSKMDIYNKNVNHLVGAYESLAKYFDIKVYAAAKKYEYCDDSYNLTVKAIQDAMWEIDSLGEILDRCKIKRPSVEVYEKYKTMLESSGKSYSLLIDEASSSVMRGSAGGAAVRDFIIAVLNAEYDFEQSCKIEDELKAAYDKELASNKENYDKNLLALDTQKKAKIDSIDKSLPKEEQDKQLENIEKWYKAELATLKANFDKDNADAQKNYENQRREKDHTYRVDLQKKYDNIMYQSTIDCKLRNFLEATNSYL